MDELYEEWQEYAAEARALGEEVVPWDEYSGQKTSRQKAEERISWMYEDYDRDLY
jgi:predicted alpha/beta hydrolase